MLCVHHLDHDGHAAGAIVRYYASKRLGDVNPREQFNFLEFDYKYPIELLFKRIFPNEEVFIVDFSLPTAEAWKQLLAITKNVTWIDHHKTAIELGATIPEVNNLRGIRISGRAACVLTWEYLFPGQTVPDIIKIVGDYDIGCPEYKTVAQHVNYGLQLSITNPADPLGYENWFKFFDCKTCLKQIQHQGSIIMTYVGRKNRSSMEHYAYLAELDGYKLVCCNTVARTSILFDSVICDYDIMAPFTFDGKQFAVTLYTKKDNVDCSAIAKKFGGGGHSKAAGFSCAALPFKYLEPVVPFNKG